MLKTYTISTDLAINQLWTSKGFKRKSWLRLLPIAGKLTLEKRQQAPTRSEQAAHSKGSMRGTESGALAVLLLDAMPVELTFQDESNGDEAGGEGGGPADEGKGRVLVGPGAWTAEQKRRA